VTQTQASPQVERLDATVDILAMRSGRDGDKLGAFPARTGVTGSPILTDALTYLEARVVDTLDGEELTGFLADVVSVERCHWARSRQLALSDSCLADPFACRAPAAQVCGVRVVRCSSSTSPEDKPGSRRALWHSRVAQLGRASLINLALVFLRETQARLPASGA
jgi:hypothetical protein